MAPVDTESIVREVERNLDTKKKLNNLYGESQPILFGSVGVLSFILLFLLFRFFATINEGVQNNYKFIFDN